MLLAVGREPEARRHGAGARTPAEPFAAAAALESLAREGRYAEMVRIQGPDGRERPPLSPEPFGHLWFLGLGRELQEAAGGRPPRDGLELRLRLDDGARVYCHPKKMPWVLRVELDAWAAEQLGL